MRLFILLFLCIAFANCSAQIIPMKDEHSFEPNAYYKDVNNELDIFTGHWYDNDGHYELDINFTKVRNLTSHLGGSMDVLVGSLHAELIDPNIPHLANVTPSFDLAADLHLTDNAVANPGEPAFYASTLNSSIPGLSVEAVGSANVTWSNLTTEACFFKGEYLDEGVNRATMICMRISHYTENNLEKLLVEVREIGMFNDPDTWFLPTGYYFLTKQP